MKRTKLIVLVISCCALILFVLFALSSPTLTVARAATVLRADLDNELAAVLTNVGFTGSVEQIFHERLEATLGRPIDPKLADLGRMLWFDKIHSLHQDNTCGGCHSPTNGSRSAAHSGTIRGGL